MEGCFAAYRIPGADNCTLVSSSSPAIELSDSSTLPATSGYVIAPFSVTAHTPVLFIPAEETNVCSLDNLVLPPFSLTKGNEKDVSTTKEEYCADFHCFHNLLTTGGFNKLVLSRRMRVDTIANPLELFKRACSLYPDAFVALFHTARSGTWLLASPEILLKRSGSQCRTMALAGTRKAGSVGEWPEKDRAEQAFVAEFIKDILSSFADDVLQTGPRTSKAGNVEHLRTDFRFSLPDRAFMRLAAALHPTPAVSGVPREAAVAFIRANESAPREYYAGFSGPLGVNGNDALFVSLRCMRVFSDCCMLYAGGGLVAGSVELDEWDETESKMKTMKNIL